MLAVQAWVSSPWWAPIHRVHADAHVSMLDDRTLRIRRPDPLTGCPTSGHLWQEAKAARDEGRVMARRGEYIDRNRVTVTESR